MAGPRNLWRAWLGAGYVVAVLVGLAVSPAVAQEGIAPILTIDQDRLFIESAFGRASLERERVAGQALASENSAIEADLIAEEQDLTERRQATATDEFAALATAFDQKVQRIRNAQDAKVRELGRTRDADQQTFRLAAGPILGKLMREKGAVAIIDRTMVILSAPAIDVTDEAIVRLDAALGPGMIAPGPDLLPAPEMDPEAETDPAADPEGSTAPAVTPKPIDPPAAP